MFFYKAVAADGKTITGMIEAKTSSDAAVYLRQHKLIPIDITEKGGKGLFSFLSFKDHVSERDVIFMTRQLSSMLESGLTLMQGLGVLKNQIEKPTLKDVVQKVIVDVEEGATFSSALKKHPHVFSPIYISIIKAGESSGLLDKVLSRLADTLEKSEKLKAQIKSALMYPVIVVILMVIVTFVMMVTVIPQLGNLYSELDVELPLPTKILIGTSTFMTFFWPFIIAAVVGAIFLFRRWHKTPEGRLAVDEFLLRLPIFGNLIRMNIMTEFSRTLGLLIGSGTLVVESLNQSSKVAGNVVYEKAIENVARRVEKGVGVGNAMSALPLFPPLLVQLAKIGEQTGKLDESLTHASEYYEREVDALVKTLTTAMEPIIMVVLGAGVAFLLISVITPIYKLTSAF